jgi:hypothetical protein
VAGILEEGSFLGDS